MSGVAKMFGDMGSRVRQIQASTPGPAAAAAGKPAVAGRSTVTPTTADDERRRVLGSRALGGGPTTGGNSAVAQKAGVPVPRIGDSAVLTG